MAPLASLTSRYSSLLRDTFGESFDMTLFWEAKYDDVQRIIAAWRDHAKLSAVGRAMLANAKCCDDLLEVPVLCAVHAV